MFSLKKVIEKYAIPYETENDLATLIDSIGEAKIVLLGEASHGTSEFYTIRAQLTKKLIEEKGFSNIAVEGDWPPCRQVNRYIKGYEDKKMTTRDALKAFNRWPTWMWANEDVVDLVDWLKSRNDQCSEAEKVGFYGIDLYSLWESMEEVINYLTHADPTGTDLELAKKVSECFEPFNRLPEHYAISTAHFSQQCTNEVAKLLMSIRTHANLYTNEFEQSLNLLINALVLKNAEEYYRTSSQSNEISWNVRDTHMVEVINELGTYHGQDAKIIVWEHNTHIGDASATTMKDSGTINVGQLLREQNPIEDVYAIGFGTHSGTVIAADQWETPHLVMEVPPAKNGSWEDHLHQAGAFNKILIFDEENRKYFTDWIDHRAIGVTYDAEYEKYNYVPSQIGNRYDAFIHVDKTKALQPLDN